MDAIRLGFILFWCDVPGRALILGGESPLPDKKAGDLFLTKTFGCKYAHTNYQALLYYSKEESMPEDACAFFYECEGCKTVLRPLKGDCCVFCSYGTMKCPPVQAGDKCC